MYVHSTIPPQKPIFGARDPSRLIAANVAGPRDRAGTGKTTRCRVVVSADDSRSWVLDPSLWTRATRVHSPSLSAEPVLIACGEEVHLGSSDRPGTLSRSEIRMVLEVFYRRHQGHHRRGWAGTEQSPLAPLVVKVADIKSRQASPHHIILRTAKHYSTRIGFSPVRYVHAGLVRPSLASVLPRA